MASIAKLSTLGCASVTSTSQSANSSLANSKQVTATSGNSSFGGTLADNQPQDQLKNSQNIDNIQTEGSSEMNNDIKNKMLENAQFYVILQRPLENNNNSGQMKISLSPELAQKVVKEKGNNTINCENSPFFAGQFSAHTVNAEPQSNSNITADSNNSTNQLLAEQLNASNHKQLKAINGNQSNSSNNLNNNSDINGDISSFKASQTINNSNFDSYETLLSKTSLNNHNFNHNIKSELSQNIGLSAKLNNHNNMTNSKETSQDMNQSNNSYSSNQFQQQLNNLTVNNTNNHSSTINSSNSPLQTEVNNIVNNIYDAKLQLNSLQQTNSSINNITNNINVEFNSPLFGNVKLNLVENSNALQITLVVNNKNSAHQLNNNRKQIINSLKEKGFTDVEINIKDLSKQNNKLKENIKN